ARPARCGLGCTSRPAPPHPPPLALEVGIERIVPRPGPIHPSTIHPGIARRRAQGNRNNSNGAPIPTEHVPSLPAYPPLDRSRSIVSSAFSAPSLPALLAIAQVRRRLILTFRHQQAAP